MQPHDRRGVNFVQVKRARARAFGDGLGDALRVVFERGCRAREGLVDDSSLICELFARSLWGV